MINIRMLSTSKERGKGENKLTYSFFSCLKLEEFEHLSKKL